ncbi:MAG: manganese efflux pump MntP family protein [Candidatus Kapaibacteriota bacterium]
MMKEAFLIAILLIAFALALDAFSVAVGTGAYFKQATNRQKFRLSFHFGLFQFIMPILGWLIGEQTADVFQSFDHWIAFAVLVALGIKIFYENRKSNPNRVQTDITRGWRLISLSIATSLDAFAVGFSLSFLNDNILIASIIIGLVASFMTYLGIHLGERLSLRLERFAATFAGTILILIGFQILLNHTGVL